MPVTVSRALPRRRTGHTTVVTVGGERFSLTANRAAGGGLGEVLIRWGKQGSASAGLADAYAAGLTLGLEHGVPLADLLRPALGAAFDPSGQKPVTFGQLAAMVPLPRSSLHDVCTALVREGFVDRGSDGQFQVGSRIVELARIRLAQTGSACTCSPAR